MPTRIVVIPHNYLKHRHTFDFLVFLHDHGYFAEMIVVCSDRSQSVLTGGGSPGEHNELNKGHSECKTAAVVVTF